MSSFLRPIDAILPRAARSFGGKARNLAALARAGFPVPAAYALSSEAAEEAFERLLPARLRPAALFASSAPAEADLAEARDRVLAAPLEAALCADLSRAFVELQHAGATSMAVRSSSTAEDQQAASAAGLHTSVLHVQDHAGLFAAVRQCWASVFSPRVFDYLHALGVQSAGSVGVVIQAMVPAEVAGVLFTVHPLTANTDELVINASYGLGSSVADGRVSPDTYYVEKDSGRVRDRVLGDKRFRVEGAPLGGTHDVPVDALMAQREALDEQSLARLVELGLRIEKHFGDARDVEWAQVGDVVYVLQARPITVAGAHSDRRKTRARRRRADPSKAEPSDVVWSNVNVGEALPGVATPLTWSVLSEFSDLGFRKAFGALGCRVPKGAQLVANFRGRIYLNLSELSQIAAQVPGLTPSRLLPLGGGAEIERLERELRHTPSFRFFSRLPLTAARFVRENLGLAARIERFEPGFADECARVRSLDLRILPSPALDETLSDVHRLLDEAGSLTLTAYGGLLAALLPLSAALKLLAGADAEKLQRDLLSELSDVESADPGRELQRIAQVAAREPAALQVLEQAARVSRVAELPAGPTRTAVDAFLVRFGHRGIREAELAEPRWREDPTLIFDTLRMHLRVRQIPAAHPAPRTASRQSGEALLGRLALPGRAAVEAFLPVVRHAMRVRERLRGHVVQVLDLLRLLARDVSRRISIREPKVGDDAGFFLTLGEMHGFLRGELRTVQPLVRMRRAGYERDRGLPDPPDTFVNAPPAVVLPGERSTLLVGLAASSGQVRGRARVLMSKHEIAAFEPGEILVVPAADVGWSPLFLLAAGLATDLGGPLSHACVVAREYGIPAVVNLRMATRTIKTGDQLLLDGDTGRVQVLGHE
ncbi:MAG TPA: PEP/pyruvate-binding domain-containing protein [Polyangiales bacterium]